MDKLCRHYSICYGVGTDTEQLNKHCRNRGYPSIHERNRQIQWTSMFSQISHTYWHLELSRDCSLMRFGIIHAPHDVTMYRTSPPCDYSSAHGFLYRCPLTVAPARDGPPPKFAANREREGIKKEKISDNRRCYNVAIFLPDSWHRKKSKRPFSRFRRRRLTVVLVE